MYVFEGPLFWTMQDPSSELFWGKKEAEDIGNHEEKKESALSSKHQDSDPHFLNPKMALPYTFSSVQFSHSVVSDSLWPHELQHARHPCPSPTPGVYSNSCPLSWWCHPAISSSQHQGLFQWVNSSHDVAKVLEFQLQHQSVQWTPRTDLLPDGLVGSPCSPKDSQESSPTPQFKSINFLVLSFLHSPTLTSIHDYWENHSLD